jgi:hypothetical protein
VSSAPAIAFDGVVFRASPWRGPAPADGWDHVFRVVASEAADAPALMGAYAVDRETVSFTPRFPPAAGLTLRAVFRPAAGAAVTAVFASAVAGPAAGAPTRLVTVYPSSEVWPANVLKFYLCFSAPMTIGDAWRRVRFRDVAGAVVEGAFVEIDQELWDPAGRRLTVLFDPGRIKRGLKDNAVEGTPFMSGRSYTLEIDADWKDARGRPLAHGVRKTIRIGPEARQPVDPVHWAIETPHAIGDPLVLCFPRPLDHALALRAITIWRDGVRVEGDAALEQEEKRLRFTPAEPWRAGRYEIAVDGIIEDLAGNKLGRLFDVDTADPTQARVGAKAMRLAVSLEFGARPERSTRSPANGEPA